MAWRPSAAYLLGDTVHQFSLVIGVYLSALGVGCVPFALRRRSDSDWCSSTSS
ncbi:MAG: hypothetical protein QM756_01130 [Polyangiaceae bacterium]